MNSGAVINNGKVSITTQGQCIAWLRTCEEVVDASGLAKNWGRQKLNGLIGHRSLKKTRMNM